MDLVITHWLFLKEEKKERKARASEGGVGCK
jgi:hypothetical protein